MTITKINNNISPKENLLQLIKDANPDKPEVQTLTTDQFIVVSADRLSPEEVVVIDGVNVTLNSVLTIAGNPTKGWTGTKKIKYRRVVLTDWNYQAIIGSGVSRISRSVIAQALGLTETGSTTPVIGVEMTTSGSGNSSYTNEANYWAYRKYLNLHQDHAFSGSATGGFYNLNLAEPQTLFDTANNVTTKALYYTGPTTTVVFLS